MSRKYDKLKTRFPLESVTVVDAEPEPREIVMRVSRADAVLPVVPSPAARAADSLVARVEPRASGGARVVLEKRDTDYQLAYLFERAGDCWRLVRTENHSL
jgi:hypothetical protein